MKIEKAILDQCDAIIVLWEVCEHTRPWNDAAQDFRQALDGATSTILIAKEGDAIVASVMTGFDGHRGWVYYLAVSPDHQRKGLGRTMMDAAEEWLKEQGAPKIQLMVRSDNEEALGFYKALGLDIQPVVTLGRRIDD